MAKKLLAVFMAVLMLAGVFGIGVSATTYAQGIVEFERVIRSGTTNPIIQGVMVRLDGLTLSRNINALLPGVGFPVLHITYANASRYLIPEAIVLAQNAANLNLLRHAVAHSGQSVADRNVALTQLNALWNRTVNGWGELGVTTSFAQAADDMRAAALEGQGMLGNFGVTVPFQFDMPQQQSSFPWLWVILGVVAALVAVAAAVAVWLFVL